jgi:hypothetical protein
LGFYGCFREIGNSGRIILLSQKGDMMARGKRRPRRVTGQQPLSYLGVEATTPPQVITTGSDPGGNDTTYDLGTIWVNFQDDIIWMLVDITSNVASWVRVDNVEFVVNGNTGSATSVDEEMNIVGEAVLTTTGSGATLTIGHTAAADGQLIIGGSGVVPAWGTVTSSDGTITITGGQNTLDITRTGGGGTTDFITDAGTANSVGSQINILGGTNINTAGAGMTVTVNLDNAVTISGKLTASDLKATNLTTGFLEADSNGDISNSEGTDGQLIIGATGAAGAWANITSTSGTILITEGTNTLNIESTAGLASPYAYALTEFGGTPSTGTPVGISSDATYLLIAQSGASAGMYSSTTGLTTSWTLRVAPGGGGSIIDVHTTGSGPTIALMAAPAGGVALHYSATVTGAYTGYQINAGAPNVSATRVWYDGTYWMITGTDNSSNDAIFYTTDPTSPPWTATTAGFTQQLNDCVFGNNTWVVVGNNGYIAYNTTDPTGAWTSVAAASSGFDATRAGVPIHIQSVDYSTSLNLFAAVSNEGRVATSPDGITWTQRDSEGPLLTTNFLDVAWDSTNSVFTAVGNNAVVSYNGITWFRESTLDLTGASIVGHLNGKAFVGKTASPLQYFFDRT